MSGAGGVAVVGAGPVGLTLALRLAGFGVPVTVLEAADRPRREGSRALCMQRETLEVWDRAGGIGRRVAERGVSWTLGRTYHRGRELFTTTLPASGHDHYPPFVNISQTEVEDLLLARAREAGVEVRFGAAVGGLRQSRDGVTLTVEGGGDVRAPYVVGADGGRSTVRRLLGLGFAGRSYHDRFLIADVRADLPFPHERHLHFDPP
ncbi:MAG TPA: FAD-dependent monooxygenase, partial [Frankiaceae bacterium]|nr:FAD-dependent monooxygenase [Frankiaceae bacterium]